MDEVKYVIDDVVQEESKETMENCGQEVAQAESGVDRLLTRSKKQKWKNSSVCFEKKSLIGEYKIMFLKKGIPESV